MYYRASSTTDLATMMYMMQNLMKSKKKKSSNKATNTIGCSSHCMNSNPLPWWSKPWNRIESFDQNERQPGRSHNCSKSDRSSDYPWNQFPSELDTWYIFKFHRATSSTPEIEHVLAATQKYPFTTKITKIQVRHSEKLKISSLSNKIDHSDHMTAFNIAMRQTHFSAKEKDVWY